MTPFEQAEDNIKTFAANLILYNLVWATIQDTEGMSEEEQDFVWQAVLAMIEKSGYLDDIN